MSPATDTAPAAATPDGGPSGGGLRGRPTRLAAIVVGVVLALLVVLLVVSNPSGDTVAESPLIGKPAPNLGGTVVQGDAFDIGATDRWVVVNFFATWCTPCVLEHPALRSFSEAHEETNDARVVSVVYDEDPAKVKEFFEDNGGDWTVLGTDGGLTATDWSVLGVPESFLVAPTGIVVARITGGIESAQQLDDLIAQVEAGS